MVKKSDKATLSAQNIDPALLKRTKRKVEEEAELDDARTVSAGAIDKVLDFAFNPSRDKIREVTIIDRVQGRLLPQLDMVALMWQYVIEVALYRQDNGEYERLFRRKRPLLPDLHSEFIYRTAQWQKSVAGKNLERATDMALAEIETRSGEGEDFGSGAESWE